MGNLWGEVAVASDRVIPSNALKPSATVRFGEVFELDFCSYELRRAGRLIKLERIPLEVLLLLVEQKGALVSREQIVEKVWGKNVFVDTDNSINAAIRKIRQALKDDPEQPRFIQTVTGRGYRFIAAVEEPAPAPLAPAPSPPQIDNISGKKISHYRIVKLLGGGGMGVVYQAEDLNLGRRVALKFLPAELATDPKAFQRIQAEARAASSLDHPNICAIYELGEHEGQPFIAMQLLEGQTLREWIEARAGRNSPLPMDEVLDLAVQIASGLEAAHQKGIIHRDIKPANIFITNHGQAKILDFGVAKLVHSVEASNDGSASHTDSSVTRTGASMGTPSYLSPEQVRGDKIDPRADIFALGLVLYEMATGRQAFPGNTITVIRNAVLNNLATPIRKINPALCPELEAIISRALEKDREKRYQTATELRVAAEELKARWRAAPIKHERKQLWIMAAVAVVLLFAADYYWLVVRPKHHSAPAAAIVAPVKSRPSVAVLGFKNLSGRSDQSWMSVALSEMLNTDLANGQHVRIIPSESVARMTADLALPAADSYSAATLQKIRNRLGTDFVVVGSYLVSDSLSGSKIRVDLHVQDTRSGEMIAAVSTDGKSSDLPDLASRGGASLRRTMNLPVATDNAPDELRASLPANSEATRFYAEGLSQLRNFDALAARHSFEQAVTADPNHALSHSALAESLSTLGYEKLAQAEAKKALDLSVGLAREDRLLIEARFRELTHDLTAAVEIYRTLHNFFPDDLGYALRLASAQTKAAQGKDALQTVEQMRALPDPDGKDAQIDLAESAAAVAIGDYNRSLHAAQASASRAQAQGNQLVAAAALNRQSWTYIRHHESDNALAVLTQAQKLAADSGDVRTAAKITHGIAIAEQQRGNFEVSRQAFEKALRDFRRIGSISDIGTTCHNYALLTYDKGDMVSSRKLLEEALRIQRSVNDDRGVAADLDDLSNVLISTGDFKHAVPMKEEALQLFREVGDRKGEAITLGALANALLLQGNVVDAKQKYEQSLAIKRELGDTSGQAYALSSLANIALAQDRLADAEDLAQQALAIRLQVKDAFHGAENQTQLAEIALEQGHAAQAETLARAAASTLEKNAPTSAAVAYAVLARAQAGQGKLKDAQQSSERSNTLARQSGDLLARFQAGLASANTALVTGKKADAARSLITLRQEALRSGYSGFELEYRIRLAQLESPSALGRLQSEAAQKGYLLLARQATSAH